MSPFSWLRERLTGLLQTRPTAVRRPASRFRPGLETLERRDLLSFGAPVGYTVFQPHQGLALAAADFNGDGKTDLIGINNGIDGRALPNDGNGTFGTSHFFSNVINNQTTAMAVGEVNGDGKLDIVLANGPSNYPTAGPTYGTVTVLLGDGQGFFHSAVTAGGNGGPAAESILPGSNISSLALADVNGDGKPDLVAVNKFGGSVYVALNQGHGIFGFAQTYHVPGGLLSPAPCEVAVGDFNGDGKPDIIVTAPRLNSVSVLLNTGNGAFGTAQTYAVGGTPTAVALGDLSGDGRLDIVTANSNGTVSVLPNTATGTFGAAQTYAVGGPANSVALGDFNHDGRLDIATTGSTETDVLLNTGNGTFAAYQKVGPAGSAVVAADFKGDGYIDLAELSASKNTIEVLLNDAHW
jgi:hypothetical protein